MLDDALSEDCRIPLQICTWFGESRTESEFVDWISEIGSIDRPRVAVTSFCCTLCCEKAEKAFMVEVPDVKPVPLRRNIAKGFSFDSLEYEGLDWLGEEK